MSNRYEKLIETIFHEVYEGGSDEAHFTRDHLLETARKLDIVIRNIGDVVYSYRYRKTMPTSIANRAPEGLVWIIRPAGDGLYKFVSVDSSNIVPSTNLPTIKVPDATPGLIASHVFSDEQALLAKLRYNRLIDTFLRATCYSLQNHLRTKVPGLGQLEVDELYLGIDRKGAQFVIPVQAKGGKDQLSVVQIEQDLALCQHRFPNLICRAVGTQFMKGGVIALMEFDQQEDRVVIVNEVHYRLTEPSQISAEDISLYRSLFEREG